MTLLEMLIVVALIAVVAGMSYPSITAGLDSLRMRRATTSVASFLTTTLDGADRRQEVVELQILPQANALLARTADLSFARRLDLPEGVRMVRILPASPGATTAGQPRRFLLYPGGAVPQIGIDLAGPGGRRRLVHLDPITAVARVEAPVQ